MDGADLSRARRLELQDQVREHTSTVLLALESVMAGCVAEPPAGPEHGGGGSGQERAASSPVGRGVGGFAASGATEEVVLAALECLKEWAKLGVSLGGLATDRPLLLDRVVRLIAGEGGPGAGGGGGGGGGAADGVCGLRGDDAVGGGQGVPPAAGRGCDDRGFGGDGENAGAVCCSNTGMCGLMSQGERPCVTARGRLILCRLERWWCGWA